MSTPNVTLTLTSTDDAGLVVYSLRCRAADLRSGAEQARRELTANAVHHRLWAGRLVDAGSHAMLAEADDLDDLAALIEAQATPEAQDEALGRRQ